MVGATGKLAAFIAHSTLDDLTPAVLDKAGACFLNAYGLAVQGYSEPVCSAVRKLAVPCSIDGEIARVWPGAVRVSALDAAMLNGVAVHAHFQDDTCYASVTHPASLIVPSAVAAAELSNAGLLQCLHAIAVGYTALSWLGAQERVARAMIKRGFRCSPSLGALGSTAAAASLLRLDVNAAANALGIAASLSGGILEPVRAGSDEWRIQNGRACSNGLFAARLAAQGVQAATQALEGPCGLLHALAGLEELPPEWSLEPDFNVILEVVAKPWATLGDNMAAAMAAKLIHDEGLGTEGIAQITVRIWTPFVDFPGTSYKGPFNTTTQALASMSYATVAMLVHGNLDYDISLEGREHPEVLRLLPLLNIEPDDDGDSLNAMVRVVYEDGTVIAREASQAPQNQLFHDREISCSLFEHRLTKSGFLPGQGRALAERVYAEVDGRTHMNMGELLGELCPVPA
ncbi:MmgE/PrpD family protein [Alcaligenaceae bacterium]|nr:MmgE/PrpD family protein [Alcaligenaceae bacterium]